jgi:hypothetical protein
VIVVTHVHSTVISPIQNGSHAAMAPAAQIIILHAKAGALLLLSVALTGNVFSGETGKFSVLAPNLMHLSQRQK